MHPGVSVDTRTHSHTHTHTESSQTKLETERPFSAVACISGLLLPFHSHVHCLINPSERSFVRTRHVIHANIMRELFTPCQWGLKHDCVAGDGRHLRGDEENKQKTPQTLCQVTKAWRSRQQWPSIRRCRSVPKTNSCCLSRLARRHSRTAARKNKICHHFPAAAR